MFALWYLSLAVDEIRKRVNCPAHLWSQKNAQSTIPGPSNEPKIPAKVPETPAAGDQSKGAQAPSKSPLKPVDPIVIPKDTPNEDERLKQLESPETVELIKTFEIPDPVTPVAKPEPPKFTPSPPPVVEKPKPVVAPVSEPMPQPQPPKVNPEDALFNPPAQQKQGDNKTTKDMKEATTDFLAQEYTQPKKTTKRYTKSRQKNNHS